MWLYLLSHNEDNITCRIGFKYVREFPKRIRWRTYRLSGLLVNWGRYYIRVLCILLGGLSLHLNYLIAFSIWDTSFWTFWTWWTLRHILGPILAIFNICHFMTIPGSFEDFSENGCAQKISFLNEGMIIWALIGLVLGGRVPRLNYGPICFPVQDTCEGCCRPLKV